MVGYPGRHRSSPDKSVTTGGRQLIRSCPESVFPMVVRAGKWQATRFVATVLFCYNSKLSTEQKGVHYGSDYP
jgi:hypothetical protein